MRRAVITQPTYLPWLGYFALIARADVFVFLDTVQFEKQSWQCRNRLKAADGGPFWLTVPVEAHALTTLIQEMRISPSERVWRHRHGRSMEASLGPTPHWKEVAPDVEQWLGAGHELLADLNIAAIRMMCGWLGLLPQFVRASELEPAEGRTARLVNLCRQVGADHYISSPGSRDYLEQERSLFIEAGISVSYLDWPHPVYPQRGPGFVSHLSALDAIGNIGADAARTLVVEKNV